jgi:hypothetical protein
VLLDGLCFMPHLDPYELRVCFAGVSRVCSAGLAGGWGIRVAITRTDELLATI